MKKIAAIIKERGRCEEKIFFTQKETADLKTKPFGKTILHSMYLQIKHEETFIFE